MIAFVRHGQTAANVAGQLQGHVDTPLTAEGAAQAERVAAALTDFAPVRVLTSPLQRARSTAGAIGARIGVEVEVDKRLIEIDYGEWDTLALADVPLELWSEWRVNASYAPPGGESLKAVTTRVIDFCTSRLDEWRDELVVAVSHVSPIKAAVCWALDVDEFVTFRMQLGLASITRIGSRADGSPYLASFNETSHLTV